MFRVQNKLFSILGQSWDVSEKSASGILAKEMFHGESKGQDPDHLTIRTMTNHFPLFLNASKQVLSMGMRSRVLGQGNITEFAFTDGTFICSLERGGLEWGCWNLPEKRPFQKKNIKGNNRGII